MLHLHRFQGEQALPRRNLLPLGNLHSRHPPRHRRLDLAVVDAVRRAGTPRFIEFDQMWPAMVYDDKSSVSSDHEGGMCDLVEISADGYINCPIIDLQSSGSPSSGI